MPGYKFGDILVINFPFAEGSGSKRRPVLVIKDTEDGDLLAAKITSKPYNSSYDCIIIEWAFANLQTASVVRIHKIQTISSGIALGKIGSLHPTDRKLVRHKLADLLMKL
jgi:mRNA interferase MazF